MNKLAVKAAGLAKSYRNGAEVTQVLKGVDLEMRGGELVAVAGPSGAGKTTLLYLIGGLAKPTAGSVTISGQPLSSLRDTEMSRLRNRLVGFVFQSHHLLPDLSALENVALPLRMSGRGRAQAERVARQLLTEMGLLQRVLHRPGELSGGEQQRVSIARALAMNPEVLLCDEPTGNLDRANSEAVFEVISQAASQRGVAVLMVTHNEELAARAHRIVRMRDGRITGE